VAQGPVPQDRGRDEDPTSGSRGPAVPWPEDAWPDPAAGWRRLPAGPEWPSWDEQARLDWLEAAGEPPDPELYPDPDDPPLPGEIDMDAIAVEPCVA
jgi:hypothetical protein